MKTIKVKQDKTEKREASNTPTDLSKVSLDELLSELQSRAYESSHGYNNVSGQDPDDGYETIDDLVESAECDGWDGDEEVYRNVYFSFDVGVIKNVTKPAYKFVKHPHVI